MSPVFQSGAFIQQCFAIHPLCLHLTKLAPERIIISCSSCNLTHRLTVRSCAARPGGSTVDPSDGKAPLAILKGCVEAHGPAIGVGTMDVAQNAVGLRCSECRRAFLLDVALFETHQR
jgi:hypothetical protein